MKAIYKPTGEIVDVEYDINSQSERGAIYRDKNGNAFCKPDLDFNNWEQLRIQIAMDRLKVLRQKDPYMSSESLAEICVKDADALIEELKKQK